MKGSGRISEGKETLENLEHLEILQPECRTVNQTLEHEGHTMRIPGIFSRLRNIKVFKNYCADFCIMEAVFLYVMCEAIVPNNRRHLRSHAFYSMSNVFTSILPQVEELFPSFSFNFETPALKALQADCCNLQLPSRIVSFINYLDSRLPIEELDITCHYNDPEDNSLLSILFLSVARHGGSLKKLRLWTWLENLSDWIFLRQSSLQDLRLEDRRMEAEENEWIRQVMANLPKSIEKLYLRGALLKREQKEQKPLTEPLKIECFARLDPQLLTQLSILNAGGLVDNQVADFICKAFKMLRKLHLSDAETDDEGFTEIAGLKGLQYLTLEMCGISDRTLKLIHFLELHYLNVAGNRQTTVSGIKSLMEGSPSLETLAIPVRLSKLAEENGPKICPRFKRIILSRDDVLENELRPLLYKASVCTEPFLWASQTC